MHTEMMRERLRRTEGGTEKEIATVGSTKVRNERAVQIRLTRRFSNTLFKAACA